MTCRLVTLSCNNPTIFFSVQYLKRSPKKYLFPDVVVSRPVTTRTDAIANPLRKLSDGQATVARQQVIKLITLIITSYCHTDSLLRKRAIRTHWLGSRPLIYSNYTFHCFTFKLECCEESVVRKKVIQILY
jgi:hypothetical protein